MFLIWNYCLMLNYVFKDYHLSVFQKLQHSDTFNQVKVAPNMADPISLNENLL